MKIYQYRQAIAKLDGPIIDPRESTENSD